MAPPTASPDCSTEISPARRAMSLSSSSAMSNSPAMPRHGSSSPSSTTSPNGMRNRRASARATSIAAHISSIRPSSHSTTARNVAETTYASSSPELAGQGRRLLGIAQPVLARARTPQCGERDLVRVQQQPAIVQPAGHRQALGDQRRALLERRAVVELVGQAQHHPTAERIVRGGQALQAPAQRVDDAGVHLTERRRLPEHADGGGRRRLRQ